MRIAVLGTGWGARVSVPAFQAAGCDVVALWSRRRERAEEEAERLGVPLATTDFAEIFASPNVDAVAIHTPPAMHLDLCRVAFEAEKHVLCDKPFAMNVTEAREMATLAKATDRIAILNYEFRHAPLSLQIKDLLDRGAIGQFHHATVEMRGWSPLAGPGIAWRLDPAQGGGILNELGSHYIDRLRQWFGEISNVNAQLASFPPPDSDPELTTEDWLGATFSFTQGGFATLSQSWVEGVEPGASITIVGSEGSLSLSCTDFMLSCGELTIGRGRRGEQAPEVVPPPSSQQEFEREGHVIAASRLLIAAFAKGIETGVSPHPDFGDGLQSQIAIDAMRESAATGCIVSL